MIKEIVTNKEELSRVCLPVPADKVQEVVDDLLDTGRHLFAEMGGLAANQVGHQARAFVLKDEQGKLIPFVNPEIISKGGGRTSMQEGCLSFPGKRTFKARFNEVRIKSETTVARTFNGFLARVIQHEMDHCDGIPF